ncbi:OmpA/MotB domain protein [Hymenobacter roseosalivarius DSM 11622]|uniref:OmpA/MotB domain protein n=1 Tax=Hymenobacter roseosalivarius DSM 11622 TaxID=645990 RepID=A0A1W1V4V3_9BACT|nr:OmpA family protein [Hymenobacter roseosalivarius]SMB88004.1 OmpA/MotB domain protein [Hymenobacter roseosalivarius DSM 11622]
MKLLSTLSKSCLLGLALLAAAPEGHAQSADRKTGISLYGSTLQYHGDLGSEWFKSNKIEYGGGITLSRYLTPGLDVGIAANYGDMKFSTKVLQGTPPAIRRFDANVTTIGVPVKFKLNNGWALKEDAIFAPYLSLAPGLMIASSDKYSNVGAGEVLLGNKDHYAAYLQGAAGIALNFSPSFGIFVQTSQIYATTNTIDNVDAGDLNDRYLQHSAGITVNVGRAKDEDGDGVADRKDKCPATPAGVAVDATGCPLDGDGDGVPDYQDKCPAEKGLATLEGCPDRDGDGIRDGDDKCPDTPGKAELQGCPDADNDGVTDADDKCPDTPAGVKVDATGCPIDTDGDGVPDFQDRCPNSAGPASNRGCPEIKAETKKRLDAATKFIQFELNKAVLKPSSYPTLEDLVKVLNEYPDYILSIAGHTDSQGSDAYNLKLSDDRAAAARTYMLTKGIPADRIESRGYGESKPITTNATAAGRALNRRVEFDLVLPEEATDAPKPEGEQK